MTDEIFHITPISVDTITYRNCRATCTRRKLSKLCRIARNNETLSFRKLGKYYVKRITAEYDAAKDLFNVEFIAVKAEE